MALPKPRTKRMVIVLLLRYSPLHHMGLYQGAVALIACGRLRSFSIYKKNKKSISENKTDRRERASEEY